MDRPPSSQIPPSADWIESRPIQALPPTVSAYEEAPQRWDDASLANMLPDTPNMPNISNTPTIPLVPQNEPTEEWPAQQPTWRSASAWRRDGNSWSAGADWNEQQGRRSLLGLFISMGIVVLLVSVVGVIVLAQLFSLGSTPNASHSHPLIPLPTATSTVKPTPLPTTTPLPANAATFIALDTTTQGNWSGVYGKQGAIVIGDTQNVTGAIAVTPASQSAYTWAGSTSDARAPQKISNPADRIAACWYSSSSFTIDVNITDGKTYQMALYLLDWDQQNRSETVNVLDPTTGTPLDSHNVQSFASGQYLVWNVRGHVVIQVTNTNSAINAVVSGLFFTAA